jgi:hypothetical protein
LQGADLPVIAHIFGGIDCHNTGVFAGFGYVNILDNGMCIITAQEGSVQHARDYDIVTKLGSAGKQMLVFKS